jgi:O-acetyl-ADP-ribose deacetylase (regulator of RNase III)
MFHSSPAILPTRRPRPSASNESHLTSATVVQACVRNALACAEAAGCRSIAIPLFGTGHARFKFKQALIAIRDALRASSTEIDQVVIVVLDPGRVPEAERLIGSRE